MAVVGKVFADRGRRQNCPEFRNGIQGCANERVRVGAGPGAIVSVRAKSLVFDNVSDPWNQRFRTLAVDGHYGLRRRSKPPTIRSKTICPYRFAPGRVVIPTIAARVLLLHHDRGMDGENAAPSHGAGGEDPD